jgi:hypothetical protein
MLANRGDERQFSADGVQVGRHRRSVQASRAAFYLADPSLRHTHRLSDLSLGQPLRPPQGCEFVAALRIDHLLLDGIYARPLLRCDGASKVGHGAQFHD